MDKTQLEEKNIYLTVNRIQGKIADMQKDLGLGEKSNLNEKRNLIAEISMPMKNMPSSSHKTIDLNINFDEIKQLLRNI